MNNKGFAPVAAIVVVALAVAGIGAYVAFGDRMAPPETATPAASSSVTADGADSPQVASWKNYADAKYGFQVKHPADWNVDRSDSNAGCSPICAGFYFGPKSGIRLSTGQVSHAGWGVQVFSEDNVTNARGSRFSSGGKTYVVFNEDPSFEPELFQSFLASFKVAPRTTVFPLAWNATNADTVMLSVYPYPQGKVLVSERIKNTGAYTLDASSFLDGKYEVRVIDEGRSLYRSIVEVK